MILINCAFLPPEEGKYVRGFLKRNSSRLCRFFANHFKADASESAMLQTHVITRLDQHYSTNCATLNFTVTVNPAVETSIGADQLRDWMIREFPELENISFTIMYMPGIACSQPSYARHL